MTADIPDKLYFKIGEVANLIGVKPHVLRYWESEFAIFRPTKSRTNQRLYRRRDIELALTIKDLLHRQRLTIAGAKKILNSKTTGGVGGEASALQSSRDRQLLQEIRRDLLRLRNALGSPPDSH
ncbi:MAG: MerR family transcriptional regulator [Desulfuromonadaceae bacterium GWC2_58_13]|nr:MAG: MerR family transcriptional regulator [Desulfuromonadaceae bacterium GWC2_58_13]